MTGNATLAGTLELRRIGGFVPALGNAFAFVQCGACSGAFDTVTGTAINSGVKFEVIYNATNVTANAVQP